MSDKKQNKRNNKNYDEDYNPKFRKQRKKVFSFSQSLGGGFTLWASITERGARYGKRNTIQLPAHRKEILYLPRAGGNNAG